MKDTRPSIPMSLQREVLVEAGHRCAISTCRHPTTEIAHIVPWTEVNEHKFENLIALCPNCHGLYDRDKKIDRKSMLLYKANLGLVYCRYGEFERRILGIFCDLPKANAILLPGWHDIHVYYLLKDGFLLKTERNSGVIIGGVPSWEEYQLTSSGRAFVENWKEGRFID